MRFFSTSLLVVAGLLVAPAFGGDGEKKREREGDGPPRIPPELLKKFDADGDGKLNEAERAVAKKTMAEHRKERGDGPPLELLKKFDTDGDGKLSEEEHVAAKKAMTEHRKERGDWDLPPLLKEFDANGDGRLSEGELAELKKVMAERHRKGAEGDQRKKREDGDK